MEPVIIALICAASFGGVVVLSSFIRQMMLSQDKLLNDEAQRRALAQEADQLERMREKMRQEARFDSHYKMLGENKDAIIYLDNKIEEVLHKKTQLVERYGQISIKESESIVQGELSAARKDACDRLKDEIDEELDFYDKELQGFQQRRAALWDTHTDLQGYLLSQEKSRNQSLDEIYKQHTSVLEKIYIRHTEDSEQIARSTIEAGTSTFKDMIMAPIQFLLHYFSISSGIQAPRMDQEQQERSDVEKAEDSINEPENEDGVNDKGNEKDGPVGNGINPNRDPRFKIA